jgi:hypothetical protein
MSDGIALTDAARPGAVIRITPLRGETLLQAAYRIMREPAAYLPGGVSDPYAMPTVEELLGR